MFFQFSPPVRQPKKVLKKEPEPDAVLSLAPFTPNPKISFENVKVGQKAVERLIIKNPSTQDVQVSIQLAVDEDTNLHLGWSGKSISQNSEDILELSWTPKEAGSWRYVLQINGGGRLWRDVPVVLKSISSANKQKRPSEVKNKAKGMPRFVTKKTSPVHNLAKRKSPLKKSTLPNLPDLRVTSPERKYRGKENNFAPVFNSSLVLPSRRDTYIVGQNAPPQVKENIFDDSLENTPKNNFSFEKKLDSDSFAFSSAVTPKECFHPEHCSTEEKSINGSSLFCRKKVCLFPDENDTFDITNKSPSLMLNNLSTETYVKSNLSTETFTKNNLSSETYTKDVNHTMDLSDRVITTPPNFSQSARLESLTGSSVKHTIEADLWSNARLNRQLRAIQEESSFLERPDHRTPMKRKPDFTFVTSPVISPKRPNLGETHLTDWTKKSTASIIDPTTGRWLERQEENFKRWLNAILAPPTDLDANVEGHPLDVAKLWKDCQKKKLEQLPAVVITNARLDSLRKSALVLYKSQQIQGVLAAVWAAVEGNRLSIRKDRDVHLDLALQADVMSVFLSYNPLWLRLGLETIYGKRIPLRSNSDVVGLTTFLWERFIRDPALLKKYKSVHTKQYNAAIKRSILKRFLALVYFLDVAKCQKLIPHDPCLFCRNAPIKESREALVRFSRDTLASMGDITKYLKHFKYVLNHKQTYLDEFDYTVTILGVDLRDGVRLTRLMERLLLDNSLSRNLRLPAISRLQKVHNMKIVFDALTKLNYELLYEICPKDIVEGHKEKTLSFLQQIIYKVQTPLMAKSVTVITHWWRSDRVVNKREQLKMIREVKEEAARKIQIWYRRKKTQQRQRELQVRIQAVVVVQSCVRMFLAKRRFEKLKYSVRFIEKQYLAVRMMRVEKEQFERLKYATLVIQRRYRAKGLMKIERDNYIRLKYSVIVVQRHFRAYRLMRLEKEHFLRLKSSTLILQRRWRAQLAMRQQRDKYQILRATAIIVQRRFRSNRDMRKQHIYYNKLKIAVVFVQRKRRATLAMREQVRKLQDLRRAASVIQRTFRAKSAFGRFQKMKTSAVLIQRRWRATLKMREAMITFEAMRSSAVVIQRRYREILVGRLESSRFNNLKTVTILVQRRWRMKLVMRREVERFQKLRHAARVIQRCYRTKMHYGNFQRLKKAAVLIQMKWRAQLAMRKEVRRFEAIKHATTIVQRRFRANRMGKVELEKFQNFKRAVILIQNKWRATLAARKAVKDFQTVRNATIVTQRRYRETISARLALTEYQQLKKATVFVQNQWRMKVAMRNFQTLKCATLVIQRRYRETVHAKLEFNNFRKLKSVTIFLQRRWKAKIALKREIARFREMKAAAVFVQRQWRGKMAMRKEMQEFRVLKSAAIAIQRRFRANKSAQLEANNFRMLKTTAVYVQRKWRAKIAMTSALRRFQMVRNATVVVQRRYRALLVGRSQFNEFQTLRKSTILVQRTWRATLAMRTEVQKFQILKTTVVMVQMRFRANRISRIEFGQFRKLKEATVLVQRRYRALRVGRSQLNEFQKLKKFVIFIQRKWRGKLDMRNEVHKFQSLKASTITIQRRFRANRVARRDLDHFRKLKEAAVLVQKRWRAVIAMRKDRDNFGRLKEAAVVIQRRYRATIAAKLEVENLRRLKAVAVFVQRKWRGKMAMRTEMQKFKVLKNATIAIQRRFRANKSAQLEANSFRMLKTTAVYVQRKWRAKIAMTSALRRFQMVKNATVVVQRRYRALLVGRSQFNEFQTLRKSTILVQRTWRATLAMRTEVQKFQILKTTVVMVQMRFRANRIARIEFGQFRKLKEATVLVQRRYRALLVGRSQFNEFQKLRIATIFLQKKWRATLAMRNEVRKFQILKATVVMVQMRFRANLIAKMEAESFRKLKDATVVIQRRWRATIEMRKDRERLVKMKKAAVVIQRRYRASVIARLEFDSFQRLRSGTVSIQRQWRAVLLMRREVQTLERLKSATVTLQRRFRAKRIAKVEMLNFQQLKKCVVVVQRRWRAKISQRREIQRFELQVIAISRLQTYARGFLVRRRYSNFLTPEAISERRIHRTQTKAAIKIQTVWRGYKRRSSQSPTLGRILERLIVANRNALPENTLGARCKRAMLQLTEFKSLAEMQRVLTDLDFITRRCKKSLTKYGAMLPPNLYRNIISTNQSPPEIQISTTAASILINFYRFEPTRRYVWIPDFIEPIITVMLHSCDKEAALFPTLCTLVWFFLQNKDYKRFIVASPKFKEKIAQIRTRCHRRARMVQKMTVNYPSFFVYYADLPLPAESPDWGMNFKARPKVFQNSVQAVECIVSVINV